MFLKEVHCQQEGNVDAFPLSNVQTLAWSAGNGQHALPLKCAENNNLCHLACLLFQFQYAESGSGSAYSLAVSMAMHTWQPCMQNGQ